MNEMFFLRNVVEALQEKEVKIAIELSEIKTPQYFEDFKDNKHCDWGKACLCFNEAQQRLQKLFDNAEEELNKFNKKNNKH